MITLDYRAGPHAAFGRFYSDVEGNFSISCGQRCYNNQIGGALIKAIYRDHQGRTLSALFVAMLRNTAKPQILTTFTDMQALEDIWEIAKLVAGGEQQFERNPFFIIYGQFTSPLQHGIEGLQRLLFSAEHRIPIIYVATPMSGMSGPIDMPGNLALGNAETLAGLTIHQLANPGAPFIYGGCSCPFDMRHATIAYGAPEWHVTGAMMSQLARYYKLPIFSTGGCTDAKCVDEQACVEAAMSMILAALGGGNIIHDVGYLDIGLCGAPASWSSMMR